MWRRGRRKSAQELIANSEQGTQPGQLATDITTRWWPRSAAWKRSPRRPTVGDPETQATLASLERVMSHLDTLLGAANPAQTATRPRHVDTNLTQLTVAWPTRGSLKGLLDKMDKGEGSSVRLRRIDAVQKLNATSGPMELLTDLKERPGRYLTVKVF